MDHFKIITYANRLWNVAEVFKNDVLVAKINKFYDVTPDWIIIYETKGGSGYGWSAGEINKKIFIGDAEFSRETKRDAIFMF